MVGLLRAWSFIRPPKNSLPTLAALVDHQSILPLLGFASQAKRSFTNFTSKMSKEAL